MSHHPTPEAPAPRPAPPALGPSLVYLVDDEAVLREGLMLLLRTRRLLSEEHDSAESFEAALQALGADAADWPRTPTCVLLDIRMGAMNGLSLFERLRARGFGDALPVIFLTGHGDVPTAVAALKQGAFDFVEKPFSNNALIDRIERALSRSAEAIQRRGAQADGRRRVQALTARERAIMWRVAAGQPNKRIALDLDISVRTVEAHRARVYDKLDVATPFALGQLLQACGLTPPDGLAGGTRAATDRTAGTGAATDRSAGTGTATDRSAGSGG